MTVKFKNSAKGVATKAKVITDTKTGNIISQAQETELVPIPMQEGMAMLGSVMQLAEVSYAAGFTKGMPNYSSTSCRYWHQGPVSGGGRRRDLRIR